MRSLKKSENSYPADWIAISLRWAAILGLVVSLTLGHTLTLTAWPLGVLLIWNLAMTTLAGMNARYPLHRHLNVAVDTSLSAAFFWIQGAMSGPASWAGLLPILTAAVYFEVLGAISIGSLFALIGLASQWTSVSTHPVYALPLFFGPLTVGGLFGVLGARLMSLLRARRNAWLKMLEVRRRAECDRLRAIYDLTTKLTSTLSYKRVLDAALDLGFSALSAGSGQSAADTLVSAVLLFRGPRLEVGATRGFTGADARVTFDATDGILKKLFDEGEPLVLQGLGYDPELSRVTALRSCTSGYCIPLRTGFNNYGALLFAQTLPNFFTQVRREVLDIIGQQAAIAVQNARLYQDLLEEKDRMVEIHEEARKKLARDLHDGPTQSVAAMAMRISIARRMLEADSSGTADELDRISDLAQRAGKEIRHTLFTLRPLVLESQGLAAAVRSIAEKMHETFSQNVFIEVDDQIAAELESAKQGLLFYIIEEAMSNARKHANAPNIWVRLQPFRSGLAILEVEDDGVGFDVAAIYKAYDKRSSLGLINLRERADLVNGVLDIESIIGRGTKVRVYVPLTREAAERLQHAPILHGTNDLRL